MQIKNYPQSIEEVETKILSSVLPSGVDEMRRHFFMIFEEESKERGAPYMVKTREISANWRVNKTATPALAAEEEAVTLGSLAALLGTPFPKKEVPAEELAEEEADEVLEQKIETEALPEMPEPTVQKLLTEEMDWGSLPNIGDIEDTFESPLKEEGFSGSPTPVAEEVTAAKPRTRRVVRRVVRKNVRVTTQQRESAAPPTQAKSFPTNFPSPSEEAKPRYSGSLRDFVKNNPNCSIEQASEYFPLREIKKNINQGRIFSRRGRLSI